MGSREVSQERNTRFSGYGGHVGSGVEFTPTRWTGGEVITDPAFVTKSLKPKRFYYSPIGDGVVAADDVEMKYAPRSQEPRVTVVQQRTVEQTAPGHGGVRVIEETWSEGGASYHGDKVTKLGETGGPPVESAGGPIRSPIAGHPSYATQIPVVHQQAPVTAGPTQSYGIAPPQAQTGTTHFIPPATSPKPQRYETPLDINTARPSAGQQPYGGASNWGGTAPPSNLTSPLGGGNRSYTGTPNSFKSFNTSSSLYEPGMRYEIKYNYLVSNPHELIHQYATTTPINVIPGGEKTTQITRETYSSTVEETSIGPLPPYTAGAHVSNPNKFVRQLRDETMTSSQRQANKNQQSVVGPTDSYGEQKIEEICRQTISQHFSPNADEVDSLTSRLVSGLNVGRTKRY